MPDSSDEVPSLLAYLDGLVHDLRDQIPAALKEFDEAAIHKSRVATRRLKSAVDLLAPILSEKHRKPFAEAGKKLRRKLGPLRDLDVMIGHLEALGKVQKYAELCKWLIESLKHDREEARSDASKKSTSAGTLARLGAWWGVRDEISECTDAIPHLLAEAIHLGLDHFSEQADWLTGVRKAPDELVATQDPHELRIAGKALRYTLEMAGEQGQPLPAAVLKQFKKMQELLGVWHDYVVLTDNALTAAHEHQLVLHKPLLANQILELSRMTLARSAKELNRFYDLWKKEGATLALTIRDRFPLSQPVVKEGGLTPVVDQGNNVRNNVHNEGGTHDPH